jgi:hypothetical protein
MAVFKNATVSEYNNLRLKNSVAGRTLLKIPGERQKGRNRILYPSEQGAEARPSSSADL